VNIWGISAGGHDASLAVLKDNNLVFASQSERFSRVKNDKNLDKNLIKYALSFGYPDICMWYEKSWKRTLRNIFFDRRFNYISPKKILLKNNIFSRVVQCNHHDSHAAACLYTFNNSAENYLIFVIDAVGEFDCISTYKIIKNKMKIIDKVLYPNSLGLFYSSITDLLGLKANEDEYILMGMASYGNPEKYYNKINNIIFKNEFGHNF